MLVRARAAGWQVPQVWMVSCVLLRHAQAPGHLCHPCPILHSVCTAVAAQRPVLWFHAFQGFWPLYLLPMGRRQATLPVELSRPLQAPRCTAVATLRPLGFSTV